MQLLQCTVLSRHQTGGVVRGAMNTNLLGHPHAGLQQESTGPWATEQQQM